MKKSKKTQITDKDTKAIRKYQRIFLKKGTHSDFISTVKTLAFDPKTSFYTLMKCSNFALARLQEIQSKEKTKDLLEVWAASLSAAALRTNKSVSSNKLKKLLTSFSEKIYALDKRIRLEKSATFRRAFLAAVLRSVFALQLMIISDESQFKGFSESAVRLCHAMLKRLKDKAVGEFLTNNILEAVKNPASFLQNGCKDSSVLSFSGKTAKIAKIAEARSTVSNCKVVLFILEVLRSKATGILRGVTVDETQERTDPTNFRKFLRIYCELVKTVIEKESLSDNTVNLVLSLLYFAASLSAKTTESTEAFMDEVFGFVDEAVSLLPETMNNEQLYKKVARTLRFVLAQLAVGSATTVLQFFSAFCVFLQLFKENTFRSLLENDLNFGFVKTLCGEKVQFVKDGEDEIIVFFDKVFVVNSEKNNKTKGLAKICSGLSEKLNKVKGYKILKEKTKKALKEYKKSSSQSSKS